jgi:ATP-dependent RNA helicase HelY
VDFPSPVEPIERLRIPRSFNARNAQDRRDLASTLRSRDLEARKPRRANPAAPATGDRARSEIDELRSRLRRHPCHGCADREAHARWAERYWRLSRDTDALSRRVENRTNSIARIFDRVCDLLEQLSYLRAGEVTDEGRRLARIYGELDLLAAECLRGGVWHGLSAAELAAAASMLVYEEREPHGPGPIRLPRGRVPTVVDETMAVWHRLSQAEHDHRLDFLREPSPGFAWAAYRWASGATLGSVLTGADLSAGDFVRWVRQLLDLLGQLAQAADGDVQAAANNAIDLLRRGVVAYSSVG